MIEAEKHWYNIQLIVMWCKISNDLIIRSKSTAKLNSFYCVVLVSSLSDILFNCCIFVNRLHNIRCSCQNYRPGYSQWRIHQFGGRGINLPTLLQPDPTIFTIAVQCTHHDLFCVCGSTGSNAIDMLTNVSQHAVVHAIGTCF